MPCQQFPTCNLLSLVNSQLAPSYFVLRTPNSRPLSSHGTIYELERSIFQTPAAIFASRLPGRACWLVGCKPSLDCNSRRLRRDCAFNHQPNKPNRQGESGICVELPTSFLIRDCPPPCLGVPSPYAQYQPGSTPTDSDWQNAKHTLVPLPTLGWPGHKLIASTLHSFG